MTISSGGGMLPTQSMNNIDAITSSSYTTSSTSTSFAFTPPITSLESESRSKNALRPFGITTIQSQTEYTNHQEKKLDENYYDLIFGIHRGGGGSDGDGNYNDDTTNTNGKKKKKNLDASSSTSSSTINENDTNENEESKLFEKSASSLGDMGDEEESSHDNMERTKLSFSTISQVDKKTQKKHQNGTTGKVKRKKKKKGSNSSKNGSKKNNNNDNSSEGKRDGVDEDASTSTSTSSNSGSTSPFSFIQQNQRRKQQQPPPPPPPPPPPTTKESVNGKSSFHNTKSYTKSKISSTSSSSSSSTTAAQKQQQSNSNKKETSIQKILKSNDYYEILNLSKPSNNKSSTSTTTLTKTQITKAYRKQAVLTHPDKNNGNRQAFDKVREAYDVLKDDVKRQVYDQYGIEGIKNPDLFHSATSSRRAGASNLQEQLFRNLFGESSSYMNSGGMFGNHFYSNSGSGNRRGSSTIERQNENVKYQIQVSLEDLYNGKQYEVEILLPSAESSTSNTYQQQQQAKTRKTIQVDIPRGMANQQTIQFPGYIDAISTSTPADLIFVVQQKRHPTFTRKGFDLVMEMNLTFKEALCGFEKEIVHLDGRKIYVRNPYFQGDERFRGLSHIVGGDSSSGSSSSSSGSSSLYSNPNTQNELIMIQTGDVHVLKGEGMPKFNWAEKKSDEDAIGFDHDYDDDEANKQYGDLYIQYNVEMPSTAKYQNGGLTPEERETLGELLEKLYGKSDSRPSNDNEYIGVSSKKWNTRRLRVSTASDFGRASGTPSHHSDDNDHDMHSFQDEEEEDEVFGFGRQGGFQYFTRSSHGGYRRGHSMNGGSFFSRGGFPGSVHGGDDDDGNVQCQQM